MPVTLVREPRRTSTIILDVATRNDQLMSDLGVQWLYSGYEIILAGKKLGNKHKRRFLRDRGGYPSY